jgi:hypothetical protein
MRFLVYTSICLLLAIPSSSAQDEKTLSYSSPDGRWKIVASWVPDKDPLAHGHYTYKLQDLKLGHTYFKETARDENDKFLHPMRFSALWSPNGRYVAINLYYGKIAYWISMIEVTGRRPREIPLFPETMTTYDDFMTSTGHWLDCRSLELEAFQPVNWSKNHTETAYKLVVRFEKGGARVISKEKERL